MTQIERFGFCCRCQLLLDRAIMLRASCQFWHVAQPSTRPFDAAIAAHSVRLRQPVHHAYLARQFSLDPSHSDPRSAPGYKDDAPWQKPFYLASTNPDDSE